MKLSNVVFTSFAFLAAPVLGASLTLATADSTPASDPTAEALPLLQSKFVDFASLHYKDGDRLGDLVARSGGRIVLSSPAATLPTSILTAVLPDGIVYWRLATLMPKKDWSDLAGDLRMMIDTQHVVGAVLDLRGNGSADYAGAAEVLGLFMPGDSSLLKYVPQEKTGFVRLPMSIPDRRLEGPIIVLTNAQTAGAAEALAGCLKSDGALVVGRTTAGTGFEEDKLSNGETLRFAIPLPEQAGDTMIRPVVPDIAVTVDEHNERAALTLIRDGHVLDLIEEVAERRRMNEASLVNGQDPEWDAYLATMENGSALLSLPRLRDPVLIAALDSLRAIRLSQRPAAIQAAANPSHPSDTLVQ